MGGARNLKLGEQRGARARVQGAIIFLRAGKMSTLFSCCVHRKDIAESRGKATGQGTQGAKPPPEAEILLACGCAMKTQICLLFNIWRRKQLTDICVVLHK